MATKNANFVWVHQGTREQQLKNHQKLMIFLPYLARNDRRLGKLLGPLWANLAEILRGKWTRVWPQLI